MEIKIFRKCECISSHPRFGPRVPGLRDSRSRNGVRTCVELNRSELVGRGVWGLLGVRSWKGEGERRQNHRSGSQNPGRLGSAVAPVQRSGNDAGSPQALAARLRKRRRQSGKGPDWSPIDKVTRHSGRVHRRSPIASGRQCLDAVKRTDETQRALVHRLAGKQSQQCGAVLGQRQ
jgi:hypothetical protein